MRSCRLNSTGTLPGFSMIGCAFVLASLIGGCGNPHSNDSSTLHSKVEAPARPPQYVMLAFDGSYSIPMWNEIRSFSSTLKQNQKPTRFTFFASCVYYLYRVKKDGTTIDKGTSIYYNPPTRGPGASDIGFGDSPDDIYKRLEQTNLARTEGHEIGSHLCGHFDGSNFTGQDWLYEFRTFEDVIINSAKINKITIPEDKKALLGTLKRSDLIGLRAPLLAINSALWPVVNRYHYRYDTSRISNSNYWPKKENGVWNFPLAQLKIVGSGKSTLSMDYNFYYAHSKGVDDPNPTNVARYEKEMLDTYNAYFNSNYYGNRAPIHIGHHFSKWNSGAYWKAMQKFASRVCGMPEVKCVTYKELADYMDTLTPQQLSDYQASNFEKLNRPTDSLASYDEKLMMEPTSSLDASRIYTREELAARGLYMPPADLREEENAEPQ